MVSGSVEAEHVTVTIDADSSSDEGEHADDSDQNAAELDPEAGVGRRAVHQDEGGRERVGGGDGEGERWAAGRERRVRRPPVSQDVGLLVLTSRVLLTLSEDERFMATLASLPAGGVSAVFCSIG